MGSGAEGSCLGDANIGSLSVRAVIDALPRAVIVLDAAGRIVLWSGRAEELYGWTEEEALGANPVDLLSPTALRETDKGRVEAALAGTGYVGTRFVRRRDGTDVEINLVRTSILDDDGQVVAVVGASEDITELRHLETQSREHHER